MGAVFESIPSDWRTPHRHRASF